MSLFRPEESCIYRIEGDNEHVMQILNLTLLLDCEDGEMWLFTDEDQYGPFCNDRRRRRGAYGHSDSTNMHGQNFKSQEVDMVFRNGNAMRFSFAFSFEFELMPGMPMTGHGGMCSWKNIKASNSAFYLVKDETTNPALAMDLWNLLTESLYNFQCKFGDFRQQCNGQNPVEVSCSVLNWDADYKGMISKIEEIIAAQCEECYGNGICHEWNNYLSQLQDLIESGNDTPYGNYGIPGGFHNAPSDYCDEKQCETGNHGCAANATCNEECKDYTCTCNEGYEGTGEVTLIIRSSVVKCICAYHMHMPLSCFLQH